MKIISGIQAIADNYSHFILDLWGVIHDGEKTYPGVIETLKFLRQQKKQIIFLSNAPRRAFKAANVLSKLGIDSSYYDYLLTSGEAVHNDLEENQQQNFNRFGKKYFYIGPQKDIDLLDGLQYVQVSKVADADFTITTGFDNDNSVLEEKLHFAIEAAKHNLPMICANPDLIVVKQDGRKMICAGVLATEYEKLGGKVFYFGKPFSTVYKMLYKNFSLDKSQKIIAVGDGLETDIKGANDFGIDSILVTGGILSKQFSTINEGLEQELEQVCSSYQVFPKFVISGFKL